MTNIKQMKTMTIATTTTATTSVVVT